MSEAAAMVESILDLARKEADEIVARAGAEADARREKARRELAERVAAIEERARRHDAAEERRVATKALLESRRELLRAKVALLDEAFDEAYRQLLSLPEDEWRESMRRLFLAHAVTGAEEVAVPAGQERRFAELLPAVNEELAAAGRRGGLRLSGEPAPIEAGFVLAGPDYTVDCSLRTLIDERRPALEPEVAGILFGGD